MRHLMKILAATAGFAALSACTTVDPNYIPPPPPPPEPGKVIKEPPPRTRAVFDERVIAKDDFDVWMRITNAPSPQAAIQLSEMRAAQLCLNNSYKFYKPTEQGLVRGQSGFVHVRVKCYMVYAEHQNMKTAANTIRLVSRAYGL
jgi:hypothetical protein